VSSDEQGTAADRAGGDARGSMVLSPTAPTGWAVRQASDRGTGGEWACSCGAELSTCLGCGQVRCLACDPYLSDDCRWKL
jgi:hypothetical protein